MLRRGEPHADQQATTLRIFRMADDLAIVNLHLFDVSEHKDRINITGIVLKAKQ